MKKTSLTRALFVAGVMAVAGGVAQADAIFYPDGTHVELGENAVENGLANAVLARSSTTAPSQAELLALGVRADQNGTMLASSDMVDTTALGAGPATMTPRTTTTTTITTTTPVYVFANSHFDADTVLGGSRPMLSRAPVVEVERTAMAPIVDTTTLGAGPAYGTTTWYGPSTVLVSPGVRFEPNSGVEASHDPCLGTTPCGYLPG